jgi:glycosyltransferase involved in cell wall biosynthesis
VVLSRLELLRGYHCQLNQSISILATVQILLASYNGERYLQAQLDSLFDQTFQDFEILAADDASTDGTVHLLETAARAHTGRIRIIFRDRSGGAAANFMRLLAASEAPYVMFCDQDDVWLPWKVEQMLAKMREMEQQTPGKPLLIHSDLAVVNANLQPLAPSFFAYQQINPQRNTFDDVVLHNCVTGCASLLNRALVDFVRHDDPVGVFMHDWWCSIAAAAFGRIVHVPEASTLYRQHGANTIGAQSAKSPVVHFARRAFQVARGAALNRPIAHAIRQARAFEALHGGDLNPHDREQISIVAHLLDQDWAARRWTLVRHGLLTQGWLRNAATLLTI